MKDNRKNYFDAESYIENVAYKRAEKAFESEGQERADYVYYQNIKSGRKTWAYMMAKKWSLSSAKMWLERWYGNDWKFDNIEPPKEIGKTTLKPGPELYIISIKDDYNRIVKKVDDYINGTKSENNKKKELKTAVDNAYIFAANEPEFYRPERHGKYLSEKEFADMIKTCRQIVEKYSPILAD